MEAIIEFLERAYEGYMATHEELHEIRQVIEVEKIETRRILEEERFKTRRPIGELINTVGRLTRKINHPEGSHNCGGNGIGDNDGCRNRDERWQKLEITIFSGEDALGWANRME